jgi:hypothetical protein
VLFLRIGEVSRKIRATAIHNQRRLARILSGFDVILMGGGVQATVERAYELSGKCSKTTGKAHKDIFLSSSFFLYDEFELLMLIRCNKRFPS